MESDQELIELANKGDANAFDALYHRYRDWVYRLAWRFTRNHQDALDVLQETFIYLLKKFPNFELTASMTTFLYPAVKHLSFNIRRKSRRLTFDDQVLSEMPAPAEKQTSQGELAFVLAILPEEQREVLMMRFVEGMNLKEIAAVLEAPVGTVKSRLYQGLQVLRRDRRTRNYFLE